MEVSVSGYRKRVCVDCGAHVKNGAPRCKRCNMRYIGKHKKLKPKGGSD